jgi:hypothetical protein
MPSAKTLIYQQELRQSSSLLKGRLIAYDNQDVKKDQEYIAASGTVGNQQWDSLSAKGRGPIPRCSDVGIEHYNVKTTPFDRRATKGIEGPFYHILPESVNIRGINRSEFGIHFDANVPGSAGCIVIVNEPAWEAFQKLMSHYKQAGLETVPLFVFYS